MGKDLKVPADAGGLFGTLSWPAAKDEMVDGGPSGLMGLLGGLTIGGNGMVLTCPAGAGAGAS